MKGKSGNVQHPENFLPDLSSANFKQVSRVKTFYS